MKLTERLRYQAAKPDCPKHVEALLEEAAARIEDQRLWREAWLNAENKVELLTSQLVVLRSLRNYRKEKECND
jgi:hypothetical protein